MWRERETSIGQHCSPFDTNGNPGLNPPSSMMLPSFEGSQARIGKNFLRFTSSAPRSGGKSVLTQSVGTSVFVVVRLIPTSGLTSG
jgi:hypothetical protein